MAGTVLMTWDLRCRRWWVSGGVPPGSRPPRRASQQTPRRVRWSFRVCTCDGDTTPVQEATLLVWRVHVTVCMSRQHAFASSSAAEQRRFLVAGSDPGTVTVKMVLQQCCT